jgi:hypothetical protein
MVRPLKTVWLYGDVAQCGHGRFVFLRRDSDPRRQRESTRDEGFADFSLIVLSDSRVLYGICRFRSRLTQLLRRRLLSFAGTQQRDSRTAADLQFRARDDQSPDEFWPNLSNSGCEVESAVRQTRTQRSRLFGAGERRENTEANDERQKRGQDEPQGCPCERELAAKREIRDDERQNGRRRGTGRRVHSL